ncbi:MAG: type IV secretion system protein [Burkholderiales bacterium]|nr:type IV secretion system protein [Burkholderiales bacterium]
MQSCSVQSGGVLDNLMMTFCNQMLQFGQNSSNLANKIFMTLFAVEFLWQLTVNKVFAGDIEKLWVFFFVRSCMGLFFAKYLVNVDVYRGIILFIAEYGTKFAGFTTNFQGSVSNVFANVTPSSMVGYFTCISDVVHQSTDSSGVFAFLTTKYLLAITLILFFVVITCIAFLLMEVFIKTYFLLYVGFILTGFAGSSWTINYWQRYLQQISAMALEFLTQCILLGVLKTQADNWLILLNKTSADLSDLIAALINIFGVSLIFLLLMYTMPRWVSNKLAGEVRLKLDNKFSAMSGGK